jgi:hypothetical protein
MDIMVDRNTGVRLTGVSAGDKTMGEAKRKAAVRSLQNELLKSIDVSRVASAIKKLATAASSHLGSDCYIHAAIAKEIMGRLGVESSIKVGAAGFRVGDGDSDVILHKKTPGMIPQPGGVAYHVWNQIGSYIFDTTLYQLRSKSAALDQLDGGHTEVSWCPDYLLTPVKSVSLLRDVIQLHAGCYHYSEDHDLTRLILSTAPVLDMDDVEVAWILYQNNELQVFGPNDIE